MKKIEALALMMVALAGTAAAQDWPQWRGPARDGQAVAVAAPKVWPKTLTRVWTVPVGLGHSSPVVVGDRVFVFSRDGEDETAAAFDLASGRRLWQQRNPAPYTVNPAASGHGKGPKATPVVGGGRLFTFGISGILSAFDATTGALRWRKDFAGQFAGTSPDFGAATSPLLDGDLLIVHLGGPGAGALTAFDAATGAVRWQMRGDGPAYASPVIATFGGLRQLVTETQSRFVGVDLANGNVLWSVPFTTEYDQNAVTPLVVGDTVLYSGIEQPLRAVRPTRKGTGWVAEPVLEATEVALYMSSPVVVGGRVIGFSHRKKGQLFALDPKTGKVLWTSEGRQGSNAALVAIGGALLALFDDGKLVVLDPGAAGYVPLASYTVADSPTWAHPVPTRAGVLVKDVQNLSLWKIE